MERLSGRAGRLGPLLAAGAAASVALLGCSAGLRTVRLGPHGVTQTPPVVVDSPPPPAKVETVPDDPGAPCAWLDGRWDFSEEAWTWTPGAWVTPPEGCHFAMPEARWVPTVGSRGLLFYFPGRWYRDSGDAACGEPRSCGAVPRAAP